MAQTRYRYTNAQLYQRKQRRKRQRFLLNGLFSLVFLALFALGFNRVTAYEDQIQRSHFTITGSLPVPVLKMQPHGGDTGLVAVVAHGFSGSKELMSSFGVELARAGITTYLFDFPGHAESTVTLPANDSTRRNTLNLTTLDEVVTYVRSHNTATTHPQIILLGHSMGSTVVGNYALAHPDAHDIVSTILVSPVAQEQPTTTTPQNLLMLVGQNDLPSTIPNSLHMAKAGCGLPHALAPNSSTFECGNPASGTGRRVVVLPDLTHLTIINAHGSFMETLAWLKRIDPTTVSTTNLQSDQRLFWLEFGVAGILLAIFPLGTLLLEIFQVHSNPHSIKGRDLAVFYIFLIVGIGATIGILFAWKPFSFLHILLADYLAGYFFFVALCMACLIFLVRRFLPLPSSRQLISQVIIGLLLALLLYFTLGQLLTFAWQRFLLTPARFWRLCILFILLLPLFLLDEGINRGYQERGATRAVIASLVFKLLLLAGLFLAIMLTPGLGFLNIVLPVLLLIFLLLTAWGTQFYQRGKRAAITTSILSAFVVAWSIAAIFPLTTG